MCQYRRFFVLAAIACVLGCGADANFSRGIASPLVMSKSTGDASGFAESKPAEAKAGEVLVSQVAARTNLKIIYNAHLEVIVKDLTAATGQLKKAIATSQGFIASDDLQEQTGQSRHGRWRIRVPTENFESLREAILAIGEPLQNRADSEDVTDQYFDLEGRIKNKKTEQEAIRRYLEDKKITAKLEEIVAVERELSRISGELEQLEGTMRRLQDRTLLATIEVNFREIRDYVPPQSPTFANRMNSAFSNSLTDMRIAGENFAVGLASAAPWLIVVMILLLPVLLILRKISKSLYRAHRESRPLMPDSPQTT
jgi:hypothetical protein